MANNILFIERELAPTKGGVQRVTYILAEELQERGYRTWYAFHTKESDSNLIPEDRKLYFCVEDTEDSIIEVLTNYILKNEIDLIVCQNVYSEKMRRVYKYIKKHLNIKFIACLHSNPDFYVNKDSLRLTPIKLYIKDIIKSIYWKLRRNEHVARMRDLYTFCDRYVMLSKRFIPVFKRINNIKDAEKLIGINNPCTFDDYSRGKKENIILAVARMEEGQKRISVMLNAWNRLFEKHKDWKLILVGGGKELTWYKSMAKKMHLQRVEFTGPSNEVEKYYSKSKIFLMTSTWEGLPMTLIESQSFGCVPVVFDSFASVHDIVNGDNGIVVRNNDLKNFVNVVDALMSDDCRLKKMSENAIQTSRVSFSKEKIIDEWCSMINSL